MPAIAQKIAVVAAIVALVDARFGQEQIPVDDVQALDGQFGEGGEAATLAGAIPSTLLGGADPCDKLSLADEIVATLGNDAAVIAAAAGLVAAEQNFNPFESDIPNICGDASLPATEALRGIVPLVDPDVTDSDIQNANSAQSLDTPFDADGLSVAEVMEANGFANFAVDGTANAGAGAGAAAGDDDAADADADAGDDAADAADDNANDNANDANADDDEDDIGEDDCVEVVEDDDQDDGQDAQNDNDNAHDDQNDNNQDNDDQDGQDDQDDADAVNDQDDDNADDNAGDDADADADAEDDDDAADAGDAAGAGDADFGICDPSIDFQFGVNGRDADEGTFLPADEQIGGAEALNPNIITERICDELLNTCEANDAAIALCGEAEAAVAASDGEGDEIVDIFNSALGL